MKLSKYIHIADTLNHSGKEKDYFLFSTRSSLYIRVNQQTLTKFQNGDFSVLREEDKTKLLKYKIIVPKCENEISSILDENNHAIKTSNTLAVTIQPTANCQFGCYYCGQKHASHIMTENVETFCIRRIKDLISLNNPIKNLSITWYGGEPLLAIPVIKRLTDRILNLSKELGINFYADMITNGYLLNTKIFRDLVTTCNIKHYQITLDGVARTHDTRRILKGSKSKTFDTIYENIKEIVDLTEYNTLKASISIRINIDKTNYHEVDTLIDRLVADSIAQKINLSFAPIENWGGNDAGKDSFTHEEFSKLQIEWFKKCIIHKINCGNLIPQRNYSICMVDTNSNEVIDAYGNTYPCWEFPYTSYSGTEHQIASMDNPTALKRESITLLDTSNKIKDGTYECYDCIFYPLCGGGCALALHEKRNACPTYKYNLSQRLLLDYAIRKSKKQAI